MANDGARRLPRARGRLQRARRDVGAIGRIDARALGRAVESSAMTDPKPALLAAGVAVLLSSGGAAQPSNPHLNPVVAKLAAGQVVYGLMNTGELSLVNARETSRAPVDFVYVDMEHSPLDFPGLAVYLLGL